MLDEVLAYLNNYFPVTRNFNTFTVKSGSLDLPFLQQGQYFRVCGSVFNDGVYQYPVADMTNETFDGAIWALAIPSALLALVDEIAVWQVENGAAVAGPYQSESFGGYSYSKKSGSTGQSVDSWQDAFAARLERWRKA